MPKSVFEKEETKRYGNILEVLMSWERIQPNKHLYAFVESSPELLASSASHLQKLIHI